MQAAVITYKAARQVAGSKSTENERDWRESERERRKGAFIF